MRKCPYCGHYNANAEEVCQHCYAGLPMEEKKTNVSKETDYDETEMNRSLKKNVRS